jgi:hypothetical protein
VIGDGLTSTTSLAARIPNRDIGPGGHVGRSMSCVLARREETYATLTCANALLDDLGRHQAGRAADLNRPTQTVGV